MTAPEIVCARLEQVTALTALVSTRIWGLLLPQSPTLPAVRVSLVGQTEPAHLRGTVGRLRARVQVDAIAKRASGVDPLAQARAVAAAAHGSFSAGAATGLAGWIGEVGSPAMRVSGVLPMDTREGYFADDLQQVVVSTDYMVWFDAA